MKNPVAVMLCVRSGAHLNAIAQAIAEASRTGYCRPVIDLANPDNAEEAKALADRIRACGGKPVTRQADGTFDGLPPDDQLDQWGMAFAYLPEDGDHEEPALEPVPDGQVADLTAADPNTFTDSAPAQAFLADAGLDDSAADSGGD